jgi:hypothetical protein
MEYADPIDDNIKIINNAFNVGDFDIITSFISSPFVEHLLNIENNPYNRNQFIEGCIKDTNSIIAEMIINSIYIEEIREKVIDYIIIVYLKYNKYDTAITFINNYPCDISSIFQEIQSLNINNQILMNLFTKYYDVIFASKLSQNNIMRLIGLYNNVELLHHIEKYYKLINSDIESILTGSINNQYCFNIVRNIFENYDFDYNTNFFVFLIKELFIMNHDEIIDYIFNKFIIKYRNVTIDDTIYYLNDENNTQLAEYMIKLIISTFNQNYFDDYINLFSLINSKQLFEIVIRVSNISYEEQVIIKNTLGPRYVVFDFI